MHPSRSALALLFALAAPAALAGNVPDLRVLGFSPDGALYVFEEVWTADGSGFPYRRLHVVDVRRNDYRERITLGGPAWEGREADLDREYAARRAATLRRAGAATLLPGDVRRRVPLAAPVSYAPLPARTTLDLRAGGRPLRVSVAAAPAPNTCTARAALPEGEEPRGATVTVNGRVFQRDARLPATRACVYGYRVEDVRVLGNRAAVLLRAFGPGFEGPDAFGFVVTGAWR